MRLHQPFILSAVRVSVTLLPVCVFFDIQTVEAQAEPPATSVNCTTDSEPCRDGLFLPMWSQRGSLTSGDIAARAIVYVLGLFYMFLGVSIVAERFLAAIEVITSKEKDVIVKRLDGQNTVVSVRIWNETVSNLTLMALGSSAPEILLACIEIVHKKFVAGELGPSTIVGSAAFNLFVIIAICVVCIPNGEIRRVKHLRVFIMTATWSIFAYIWLYFILSVSSYGVVDVWEAVLTFLFFPATVITAYIADKKLLVYKLLSRKYRSRKGIVIQSEGLNEMELVDGKSNYLTEEPIIKVTDAVDGHVREFEQHRQDFIEILRELRKKHPNVDMRTLEEMAELEAVNRGPKSRAFYRIQATRMLTGGGKVIKKSKLERRSSLQDVQMEEKEDDGVTRVFFDPCHYTVMENVGTFSLTVTREGRSLQNTLSVDFNTEDGTANGGSDYESTEGTLFFQPGEKDKQFPVTIIDDDIFEEDEHFYVRLSNLRIGNCEGKLDGFSTDTMSKLVTPSIATVMILDDDHPGIFHFDQRELTVTENVGELIIKCIRSSGARGCVAVPFRTVDGTAKAGKDFEVFNGELYFENDEIE